MRLSAPLERSRVSGWATSLSEDPNLRMGFIVSGDGRTFILRDFALMVGSTSVRGWIEAMLDGGDAWMLVRE